MSDSELRAEHFRILYKARLAEQAERYEDLKEIMKHIAYTKKSLTEEERHLFGVGYKNYISPLRMAYRCTLAAGGVGLKVTSLVSSEEEPEVLSDEVEYATRYATELGSKILDVCKEVQQVVAVVKAAPVVDPEADAFYHKVIADYKRYAAEIDPKEAIEAERHYDQAHRAASILARNHPTRLGIELNYAVFKYEVQKDINAAIKIVETVLDDVQSDPERTFNRDSVLTYQLLKDNLNFWLMETRAPLTHTTVMV